MKQKSWHEKKRPSLSHNNDLEDSLLSVYAFGSFALFRVSLSSKL